MRSDIRVCSDWEATHERPVYTLDEACPECGADAVNSAPAPFNPEDPYGEYRRRARRGGRRRAADEANEEDDENGSGVGADGSA